MKVFRLLAITAALLLSAGAGAHPRGTGVVIQVAEPTGHAARDRANIEDAIGRAAPGDTVLFAKGTYVIGLRAPSPPILVQAAGITLLGSVEGTTIFGGDVPDTFEPQLGFSFLKGGNGVRRLTFESFSTPLLVGVDGPPAGGYTIADNVFKNSFRGILGTLDSSVPTRITRNQFINVAEQYDLTGHILYFTNNTDRTPDPDAIPRVHRPFNAGGLFGDFGVECNDNVIENNTVEGNVDGFFLLAIDSPCRRNVIRNNSVSINLELLDPHGDGGTLVVLGGNPAGGPPLENALVEGNFIDGTKGYGIQAFSVSNSTFQGNVVRGVQRNRTPEQRPGGIAILLADSRGNSVSSNQLQENEFCDVFLDRGTANNVVVEPNDTVIDHGQRNLVRSGGTCVRDASALDIDAADRQAGIPAKARIMLDELHRVRAERAATR